jgi:hypothetical protein
MPRTRYEYTSVPKGTGLASSRRGITKGACWIQARLKASVDKLVQHVYRRPLCVGSAAPEPWEYVGSALPNGGTYKAQAGDGKALWLLQKLQEELDCVPAGTLAFWDRGRVDGLKAAIDLVHRAFGIG